MENKEYIPISYETFTPNFFCSQEKWEKLLEEIQKKEEKNNSNLNDLYNGRE